MTPAEVMWHRSEPAVTFESDIEDAKRMLKERPELVQPEAAEAKVDDLGTRNTANQAPSAEADTPKESQLR